METKELSNNALKCMHGAIRHALDEDDARPTGPKPYGVRETADWRRQADEFEAELTKRSQLFEPIIW
jgi:hypothetical protein